MRKDEVITMIVPILLKIVCFMLLRQMYVLMPNLLYAMIWVMNGLIISQLIEIQFHLFILSAKEVLACLLQIFRK